MLKSCQLFENGGNYDEAEVQWYQTQMDEINEMIAACKTKRLGEVEGLLEEMKRLGVEPEEEFTGEYKHSIEELSAKDGLGKTYGQPRRFAQERLRSEMTKCEEAQKGVDKLLESIDGLISKAFNEYGRDYDYAKEKVSLSIGIRVNLVSVVRMMIHYGKHLGGFKPVDGNPNYPEDLPRISYLEDQEDIALQESEVELDETRMADELEHLGPIGFKNANEEYYRFPEAIMNIDKTCRELVTKLYTGDNAKHLVGDEKIPEYLTRFLANMHRQVEEFKINCVRQLRMASEKLVELCQRLPSSIFMYLQQKYESITLSQIETCSTSFQGKAGEDKVAKEEHLRLFRPNLENPANKEMTKELNE
jgi:golgin subfamily A member 4|tara:strand:+ start:741 stop:1826 length:1086 start_codon:yes stop_codon:yes gene_type:complete